MGTARVSGPYRPNRNSPEIRAKGGGRSMGRFSFPGWRRLGTGVAALLLWAGGAAGAPLSAQDYLTLVAGRNPDLEAARQRVLALRSAAEAVAGTQRPQVHLVGDGARVLREQDGAASLYLAVTHRFDPWGKDELQLRQALLQHDQAAASFAAQGNRLLQEAERLYWDGVLAKRNLVLQETLVRQREEDLRVTKRKFDLGAVPKLDVVRAEVALARAQGERTRAGLLWKDALVGLARLAGGEAAEPSDELVRPVLPRTRMDPEWAFLRNPEAQALRIALEAARAGRDLAALGSAPEVNGRLTYTVATDQELLVPPQDDARVSLEVSVPLYDGGQTRARTVQGDRLTAAASQDLETKRQDLIRDLETARNRWEEAWSQEETKRREMGLAAEELRIARLRYDQGVGSQLDLLDAQTKDAEARVEHLRALQGLFAALTSLRGVLGEYVDQVPLNPTS